MSDELVRLVNLGKKYRLYKRPADKVLDSLGLGRWAGVGRRSEDFWALRNADLAVRRGERVGIIGRNGAGKSTLLKAICGTVRASEGRVEVRGNIQALMEMGTGFHPEFTGRENIRAALSYQGLGAGEIRRKTEEIVEFSELEEFIERPVRTYSGGMYARLAFATATAVEPDLLVIDEILGAGDAYFAGKCLERMRALTESSGATVLFVSHDLGSVQRLCPRAVWIERGRVRRDGDSLDVIKEYSAVVRQEEELRLRARDMKLHKAQAGSLESREDLYREMLLHFVPANGGPLKKTSRIYGIRLFRGNEQVAAIAVGGPMDNSGEYPNCVLTARGFMEWGECGVDGRGAYRLYGDFGGRYGHAPFKLGVPRSFDMSGGQTWRMKIDCEAGEAVAVELYTGEGYRRLGLLEPGKGTCEMTFGWPAGPAVSGEEGGAAKKGEAAVTAERPARDPVQEYGSMEARITGVRMYNGQEDETRVLEMGSPVRIEMDYFAGQKVVNPIFVFCVYLPDGQCASQWASSSREAGAESIEGAGRVVFRLQPLHLGQSAYVATAAIFKRLRGDQLEAESYHVMDRCIHFQVMQASGEAVPRGLCLQPFEAEVTHG